jgi:3-hydroxymyristoyl/3-hydroxydecanoyl-(acyl carrier protein) dehydratase
MAFRFVDRISVLEPGRHAVGHFRVPEGRPLAPFLAAEAVGQLAGWVAIAARDFTRRPVAAIAGRAAFRRVAKAGSDVELEVSVDAVDDTKVTYAGTATSNGEPILTLERCLGPMLPISDFDDPEDARARFERLRAGGESAGGMEGDPAIRMEPLATVEGSARWRIELPRDAPFLVDHFPRKPVIPGTLFLEAQMEAAVARASELLGAPADQLRVTKVHDVKLRRFLDPGDVVDLAVDLRSQDGGAVALRLTTARGATKISTAGVEIRLRSRT